VYCTNCGVERPANALACPSCGTSVQQFTAAAPVPNYLVHSILVTICCCLPFGVVALVYSAQVNSKLAAGDIAGAEASSRSARTWVIVAAIAGVLTAAGSALVSFL